MKRAATVLAIAATLLLLTGCGTGTPGESVTLVAKPVGSPAPSASDAPLTAQTPEPVAPNGEAAFLEEVRAELRPDNVIPNATDEQLLEAGAKACAGIASGVDTLTLSLIDGEPTNGAGYYTDSGVLISAARSFLCD